MRRCDPPVVDVRSATPRHGDTVTAPSLIDFRLHAIRTGSEEAGRVDFHRMLSALVGVSHPTATDIRADPGDWGIDVFVGSLVERISIWQSKFFYDKIGDSQKGQIRESFKSAMANAKSQGYLVEAWTLCVACELSAPERKWWDGKVRVWQKDYPDISFDLWDAPRLRRKLMSPDAEHVCREFYGADRSLTVTSTPGQVSPDEPLPVSLEETPGYEGALFVRQMSVAGIQAIDAQRSAFFNADLLVRDVSARSVPEQLAAVREIDSTLLGSWEDAMADPATTPNVIEYEPSAKRLFSAVMRQTQSLQGPPALPVRRVHARGLMHRIVDEGRAGWVHDWKDVADVHAAAQPPPEPDPQVQESAPSPTGDEVEEIL